MNSRIAVVPGSFDPPTLGHLDVIRRAASLYDELHVLVVHNPGKEAMLPIAQRLALLEQSIAGERHRRRRRRRVVEHGSARRLRRRMSAPACSSKGIRSQIDVAYETPMAIVNRHLAHVETVFLLPDPAHALVSSSLVRQVAALGGDVSPFVPPAVARFLDTGAAADARPSPSRSAGSMDPREKPQARSLQHQRARHRAPPGRDARSDARRARCRAVGRGAGVDRTGRARRARRAPRVRPRGHPRRPERSTPSTPASAVDASTTSPRASKSSFRSFSRILERKQLTSRFKTTTWILKLSVRDATVLALPFQPVCRAGLPRPRSGYGRAARREHRIRAEHAHRSTLGRAPGIHPRPRRRSPARVAQVESPRTQKRASHGR